MRKRTVESIVKEVALESKLPEFVVKAIMESQFQLAREEMQKGESGNPETFLNVRLRHLGLLVAKPGKIKRMHNLRLDREAKEAVEKEQDDIK